MLPTAVLLLASSACISLVYGLPTDSYPVNYQYAYEVVDNYANVNYGQEEGRNGYATNGQYHVLLPDGRVQTVTYAVGDAYSGYIANVEYSGEARIPQTQAYVPLTTPRPLYNPVVTTSRPYIAPPVIVKQQPQPIKVETQPEVDLTAKSIADFDTVYREHFNKKKLRL